MQSALIKASCDSSPSTAMFHKQPEVLITISSSSFFNASTTPSNPSNSLNSLQILAKNLE
jgi:hypothetical protein